MVVFDPQRRVASLNPAAAGILGTSATAARGKTAASVLPTSVDLRARLVTQYAGPFEVQLGSGAGARSYEADLSPLHDFRGLLIAYLLMLRDVTEQREAQARILEQQQTRSVVYERERLARELHDSLVSCWPL